MSEDIVGGHRRYHYIAFNIKLCKRSNKRQAHHIKNLKSSMGAKKNTS